MIIANPPPLLCIVDPNLRDFVGHHFAYDHAVAEAARGAGFLPLVLGHRALPEAIARQAGAVPAFSDDIWAHRGTGGKLLRWMDDLARNRRFGRELLAALPPEGLPPGSIVLAHMLTHRQLLGLAAVAEALPHHVTIMPLLRYQPEMVDDALSARAFARFRRAAAAGARIRFASDSARLAHRLARLVGLPVEVLPIPHTPPEAPPLAAPTGRPMHLVSLGNARDEKGFLEIIWAIQTLREAPGGLSGLRFTLQANDPSATLRPTIQGFIRDLPPEVTLLHEALPPAAYDDLLASADLVLLPYWRSIYEARTSGVLLEALAAGRPVICTAQSWLADELARHGAGITVPDRDVAALARAIQQARDTWPDLARDALAGRAACLARHGGAAFMRAITAPAVKLAPEPPRRLQVFYPWPDFAERRAGASQRCNMMVDALVERVEAVRVLQPGHGGAMQRGPVEIQRLNEWRLGAMARRYGWLAFQALCLPLLGWQHRRQALFPWLHLQYRFDPLIRRRMVGQLTSADAVLLEYGFWSVPVVAACRRLGIPCVLTAHDVIEDQVTASRLLHRLTGWLEHRALRAAQAVVAVTPQDAARFATLGVTARVVPNPVDLNAADAPLPGHAREILAAHGVALPAGDVCLFVGSLHPPNLVAVDRLRRIAAGLADTRGAAAPLIMVAGAAAEPGSAPGFLALGRVEDVVLRALYRSARLAVIPLPDGTGSSLKTLEAMAARLPILCTGVALRGIGAVAGQHAVVEDDLDAWAGAMTRLLADPNRLQSLAAAGRALAEGFGHQAVMAGYAPLLGLADAPQPDAMPGLAEASSGSRLA